MKDTGCETCPLKDAPLVYGTIVQERAVYYPNKIELMIIGRDPGVEEARSGIPFVGKSGKLLRRALKECGVYLYYLTNAVKCRPPGNIANRTAGAMCVRFLKLELELINPSKVVALGSDARVWTEELQDDRWRYAIHPGYIVRTPGNYNQWLEELTEAVE